MTDPLSHERGLEDREKVLREPSDRSLLNRLREGNEDAATALYSRYARRLRALIRSRCSPSLSPRLDPDDIVQSVFYRFFQRASKGDYDVPAGGELWSLLLVIALNKLKKAEAFHCAGKRDVRLTSGGEIFEDRPQSNGKPQEASQSFLEMIVTEAMNLLPSQHRRVAQLRLEGHEVAEIARQTARSHRTIERLLQETRTKLGGLLHENQ